MKRAPGNSHRVRAPRSTLAAAVVVLGTVGTAFPARATGVTEPNGNPAAHDDTSARREAIQADLEATFSDPRYRFCHDEEYEPLPGERVVCSYGRRGHERCPALARVCTPERAFDIEPPWFARAVARALFWIVMVAGLAVVLYFVVRALATRRAPGAEPEASLPDSAPDSFRAESPSGRPMDRDAQRLWSTAHELAAAGKYDEAMHHAYAALLRQLESEQLLHIDSTQTNGDFVRQLRTRPEHQSALRGAAASVEAVQFGVAPATEERFHELLGRIRPSLPSALTSLLVVLTVLVCGTGCGLVPSRGFSARLDGADALRTLLEQRADDVRVRRGGIDEIDPSVGTIVVLPGFVPEESERDVLLGWTRRGGLLVLTSPMGFDDEVMEVDDACGISHADTTPACTPQALAPVVDAVGNLDLVGLPASFSLGTNWTRLLACGQGAYAGIRYLGDGAILAFAAADFVSNAALATSDNGHFLLHYMADPGRVELLDRTSSRQASSPYLILENPTLANALWHALALLCVFYLWKGVAFGKLRDPVIQTRRAFAEHVEALGLLYRKRGASRMVLAQYGGWLVDRMRASLLPGRDTRILGLANAVHQRTAHPEADIVRALAEVHTAKDELDSRELADDFRTIRTLEVLAKKMGGPSERR